MKSFWDISQSTKDNGILRKIRVMRLERREADYVLLYGMLRCGNIAEG